MDDQRQRTSRIGLGGDPECQLCPLCALLRTLSDARPEAVRHLLGAARELALALAAVVESQTEAFDRAARAGGDGLRRIRVE